MTTFVEALVRYVGKNVTVFLMNGYQIRGTITEVYEDGGLRVCEENFGRVNTIASHAISTVREIDY